MHCSAIQCIIVILLQYSSSSFPATTVPSRWPSRAVPVAVRLPPSHGDGQMVRWAAPGQDLVSCMGLIVVTPVLFPPCSLLQYVICWFSPGSTQKEAQGVPGNPDNICTAEEGPWHLWVCGRLPPPLLQLSLPGLNPAALGVFRWLTRSPRSLHRPVYS